MVHPSKYLALLPLLATLPAHALFSNGGFENLSEGLNNWNVKYGEASQYLAQNGYRGEASIVWTQLGDQPLAKIVEPTTDANNTDPAKMYDPFVPVFNYPYEGTHKALLNYHLDSYEPLAPGGMFHATQISQTGTVGPDDIGPDGKYTLYISWGGVMNNPNHPDGENPFFEIKVNINGTTVSEELHYSNQPHAEWKEVTNPLAYTQQYYTNRLFKYDNLQEGDIVEVIMTVADCAQGAHGVYAWIDYAGTSIPDTIDCDTCVVPEAGNCVSAKEYFRMGDYSSINGNVVSGGYGEMGARAEIDGNFSVKGVSFLRSYAWLKGDFTYEAGESSQEGATITGNSVQGAVDQPQINTYVIVPASGWTEVGNGQALTLNPGVYGDLTVRANATLTLKNGSYIFGNLNIEPNSTVIIKNAGSQTDINVAYNLDIGTAATLLVDDASKLLWYTHDSRVELHSGSNIFGAIIAPVGEVVLQPNSVLAGSIEAARILIEANSRVICEDGVRVPTSSSSSDSSSSSSVASSSSSNVSSSSSGENGDFVCAGACLTATTVSYSYTLNTTDEVWFVTDGPVNGWQISEASDRTISVNGVSVNPGETPLTPAADGKYYFNISAGSKAWASWSRW
jgi:hypothetical protein